MLTVLLPVRTKPELELVLKKNPFKYKILRNLITQVKKCWPQRTEFDPQDSH